MQPDLEINMAGAIGRIVIRGRPGPRDRPALPPGHPNSWGAITDGTVLDRAAYPFPIFAR